MGGLEPVVELEYTLEQLLYVYQLFHLKSKQARAVAGDSHSFGRHHLSAP